VEEVLVHGEAGPEGKDVLTAQVVPRPDAEPDEQELREYCSRELAAFKVPRRVYFVEKLPRTAGGKLRRYGPQEAPVEDHGPAGPPRPLHSPDAPTPAAKPPTYKRD
jgi:acyl-CoA synthetase (AMP-forming)/AMP-acid ligase II